jgi:hypothetical protein
MISAKQCAIDEFAALPIEKHITGSYAITTPGVPSKIYLETLHRYGIKTDDKLMAQVHPHDPHWLAEQADQDAIYQVIVPANYSKMLPYGILVFINSRDSGMLFRQYHPLLEKHRLIAIGADHSGNTHATITLQHRQGSDLRYRGLRWWTRDITGYADECRSVYWWYPDHRQQFI